VKPRLRLGVWLTATAISLTGAAARAGVPHAPPPPWLAQPAQSTISPVTPTAPLRALGLLALVAIAGGVALVARKRLTGPSPTATHPRLRVLDTVRLADKSHLVLTRVGERCLLLGVTSSSVRRIAWLRFAEPSSEPAAGADPEARADARTVDGEERHGFPNLLRQAFSQEGASPPSSDNSSDESPAALIAAKTMDTVEPFSLRATMAQTASSGARRGRSQTGRAAKATGGDAQVASLVEAQASGLAARRRR
jgi:flagellar biogenesis protein FliO